MEKNIKKIKLKDTVKTTQSSPTMMMVLVCSCPNACCSIKDVHVYAVNSFCFVGRHVGGVGGAKEEEDVDED